MGFTPDTSYRVKFEPGDKLHGLEIVTAEPGLGDILDLGSGQLAAIAAKREATLEDIAAIMPLFDMFIGYVQSWNLEIPKGNELPVTTASLLKLGPGSVLRILDAWLRGVVGVDAPLAPPSNDGDTLEEGSIPMAPLSASQAS